MRIVFYYKYSFPLITEYVAFIPRGFNVFNKILCTKVLKAYDKSKNILIGHLNAAQLLFYPDNLKIKCQLS